MNIDHLYFAKDNLKIAKQKPHPHGHGWSLVNNVDQYPGPGLLSSTREGRRGAQSLKQISFAAELAWWAPRRPSR